MKTYILDTIDRFKRYSQTLDVQTILCQKAWYVLNEDGDDEKLIFQKDGTIIVSINGTTKTYQWEYIPSMQSVHIKYSQSEGIMLKPAFLDGIILAFQKTGTKECMFLIDNALGENKKTLSLSSVKKHLLAYEDGNITETEIQKLSKELELANAAQEKIKKEQEEARKKEGRIAELQDIILKYERDKENLELYYKEKNIKRYEKCLGKYTRHNYDTGDPLFNMVQSVLIGIFTLGGILGGLLIFDKTEMWVFLLLALLSVVLGPLCGHLIAKLCTEDIRFNIFKNRCNNSSFQRHKFDEMNDAYVSYVKKELELLIREDEIEAIRQELEHL